VRGINNTYFNGERWDSLIAIGVALPLSLLAVLCLTFVIRQIGWIPWYLVFLVAPTVAGAIAEAVRWGVKRRRSRYLAHVAAGCFVAAILPFLLVSLVLNVLLGDLVTGVYGSGLLELSILLVVGTGAIMARLRC
jgi:hypothetical protein